jgi:hypothetical protein
MGVYINAPEMPKVGKVGWLEDHARARKVDAYGYEVKSGEVLICVVLNLHRTGGFDAAGIMFDNDELRDWLEPEYRDDRPKTWLVMDRAEAFTLAGVPDPALEV